MGGIEPVDFSKKAALLKNGHKVSELFDRTPLLIGKSKKQNPSLQDFAYLAKKNDNERADRVNVLQSTNETNKEDIFLINNSSSIARSRWRRATHSVAFMNHLAASIRSAATDLVEDRTVEEIVQQASEGDAAAFRARTCERLNTAAHTRIKGRKGMESLLVQQNRNLITFLQGLYVACLKMPIGLFLVGVFLAPVLLGLLFTSIYLLDVDGLSFNGIVPEDATTNPLVSAKQRCLAFLNVFLYALSLSTTFGGAPVAAESPFCLLVANINTLLAQFLFVFLSGAVFARMSQPSSPIRCSKKAIIKADDLSPLLGLEQEERYSVFEVRLVLSGPPPCELIGTKVSLTFRIFVTLTSGSVFCATHDLEVVRSEVPYLRYGLMVRHIIDRKSPVYGHTMESLHDGDASFSLTLIGMERASMQPVFHSQDYFICDGDVICDGEYEDFIQINEEGIRVLDHSRIDLLRPSKAAVLIHQDVSGKMNLSKESKEVFADMSSNAYSKHSLWYANWPTIRRRTLFKSMSTSFTRAER